MASEHKSYDKRIFFYAYAFNSCRKGLLATGYNHIFFTLNPEKTAFEMKLASNESLITTFTVKDDLLKCTEKGCIFSYVDLKTGKKCDVALAPCKDKKYMYCPKMGKHFTDMLSWSKLLKQWFDDKMSIIDDKMIIIAGKQFKSVDKKFKSLPALSGGKRKKNTRKHKTRKLRKSNKTRKQKKKAKKQKTQKKGTRK
jgi:hypothetical protein